MRRKEIQPTLRPANKLLAKQKVKTLITQTQQQQQKKGAGVSVHIDQGAATPFVHFEETKKA